jgi:hypothetical protein
LWRGENKATSSEKVEDLSDGEKDRKKVPAPVSGEGQEGGSEAFSVDIFVRLSYMLGRADVSVLTAILIARRQKLLREE